MAFIAECHEGEIQRLVRTVEKQDLVFRNAKSLRCRCDEGGAGGVRVKLQTLCRFGSILLCLRRRWERGFVGIEFDVGLVPRLFTGDIGGKTCEFTAEKTAHKASPSVRIRALAAWPVRPSAVAKAATSFATSLSA